MLQKATPRIIEKCAPPAKKRIQEFKEVYELELPESLLCVLECYGEVQAKDQPYKLLGLTEERDRRPTIASILAEIRFTQPDFPSDLIPVEVLPERQVVCVECADSGDPVVLIDLDDSNYTRTAVAPSYSEFVLDWLADVRGMRTVNRFLSNQKELIDSGKIPADKAARPDDWRAYRFCSQDILVGVPLIRFNRDEFITEVAALPSSSLSLFNEDAPIKALLTLIFSDAYRSGGNLSIKFVNGVSKNRDTIRVPNRILRFANKNGIRIADPKNGIINANTAKRLFIECQLCSDEFKSFLRAGKNDLDAVSTCFAISSGLWSIPAAMYIAYLAYYPNRVFKGASSQYESLQWTLDRNDASNALLLDMLVNKLRSPDIEEITLDCEDALRNIEIVMTGHGTAVLSSDAPLQLNWFASGGADKQFRSMEVLPLSADKMEMKKALPGIMDWIENNSSTVELKCILVSKDFESIQEELRPLQNRAKDVELVVSPLYSTTIEADVARRLMRARTCRQ